MASTYPFSTTWTGKGDGTTWSQAANWSNGVPLTGQGTTDSSQDVAMIDNSVDTAPYTVVISGTQNAGEIDVNATDPANGPAVRLTGTLGEALGDGGFGPIKLTSGTFEIDGGTLSVAEVEIDGGTLAFGSYAQYSIDTLNASIVDGNFTIGNDSVVDVPQNSYAIFDGTAGYGSNGLVTIADGSTLNIEGSFNLAGEIDVKTGGILSLNGGSLNGWGSTGTLYADGGAINLTSNISLTSDYTIEGGLNFAAGNTISVNSGATLTLGNDALSQMVVNLNGGTIDVSGVLDLDNVLLENGTVILESGSSYVVDNASIVTNVGVINNQPAGQTNWTGGAGDGDWSNGANWTNGVPQSGLGFTSDGQSLAVINNAFDTTPFTVDITGSVNAQDILVGSTDPSGEPSVLLTGTLDTSYNGEGGAYGTLNLASGTFEIDGGTLYYTGIQLNGGNLSFGSDGQNTLVNDIINGDWSDGGAEIVLTQTNDFHGGGGSGPANISLYNGAQIIVASGELSLDGVLDIQDYGGQNTLFALEGGNLTGENGDTASIFMDGGAFAIDASATFFNSVAVYGNGAMVFADATDELTIDSSSTTTIGMANADQTTVNLNGATIDVFGTLTLTNTYIENGTIIVENGATFNQDSTDDLNNVTVTGGGTVTTGGVINNNGQTIDAGATPFSLNVGTTIEGGTIVDPGADVTFNGGTLQGVTYQGTLELGQDNASLVVTQGLTAQDLNGNTPGTIDIEGYQASVTFDDTQTIDNVTIDMYGEDTALYTAVSQAAYQAAGNNAVPATLTLGSGVIINSAYYGNAIGNPLNYATAYGATTLVNDGTINVTDGTLEIDPTNFINDGTINVENYATLDLEGNWVNDGTITVSSSARLELGGSFTDAQLAAFGASTVDINGTLDNTGNTLNVGTNEMYTELDLFSPGVIEGGTIDDAGGGIVFDNGTLSGVTYEGAIDLTGSNVSIHVSNGLKVTGANGSGSGVITLAGYQDYLLFNDTQTFDNATVNLTVGSDTLSDVASYAAYQAAGYTDTSPTLTLGANLVVNQVGGYNYLGGLYPYDTQVAGTNYGTPTLVNKGIINVNAGTLVINPTTFVNQGTINVASGATLFLDGDWSNLGTISLASGSTIEVGGDFTIADLAQFNQPGVTIEIGGVLDNTGATLNVGSGQTYASLTLEGGGSIKGGTVNDSGGIVFNGGALDGVTYNGSIDLGSQYQSLTISNGTVIDNADGTPDGSITLDAYDQNLNYVDSQTVDGYTVNLSGLDDSIQVYSSAAGPDGQTTPPVNITFGSNLVINSSGTEFIFGNTGTGAVTNDGTINVTGGSLSLEPSTFVNDGTIDVANGASLYLYGLWSNNGTISDTASNIFLGGTFDDAALYSITNNGGKLYIDGTLENSGGVLTIGQGSAVPAIALGGQDSVAGEIDGGIIKDSGSGLSLYGFGALDDVTYEGVFNLTGTGVYTYYYNRYDYTAPTLFITNGLTLTGANGTGPGELDVSTGNIPLNFTGTQTFDNATVTLGADDSINAYAAYPYAATAALTLGANLTIDGAGGTSSSSASSLGGNGTITNDGAIDVTSGVFVIDPTTFANAGTITVEAGATLYIEGAWSNTGTITLESGASLYLEGTFNAASVANIVNNGGTIYATSITVSDYAQITQGYSAAISGISLTDPGATSSETETVTISDATGLLSATGNGVSGSGTTTLVLTGSLDQVNADLATLTDVDTTLGADNITVAAVDSNGNNAPTRTIQASVIAPIVISVESPQSIGQGVATSFYNPEVYEQGALNGANLTVTISDTTGILTASGTGVTGSGTTAVTLTGSQTEITDYLETLTITEAGPGPDTVTWNAQDVAGDKAQTATIAITTLSPPSLNAPSTQAVTQNSITAVTGVSVSEAGAQSYEQFTVTLTDTSGLLQATGSGVSGLGATSITLTGSLSQINADLATLTDDDQNAGTETINVKVVDAYNGTASQNIAVTSTHVAAPDLTVSAVTAPASDVQGQSVQVSWTITNSGDATAVGPWTDNVYVASDAAGDNKVLVGSFTYNGTLTQGQTETENQTVTVPSGFSLSTTTGAAPTYFIVQADADNGIGELSGIQNHVGVSAAPTAATETVDWPGIFSELVSTGIDPADYSLIEQRFVAEVGTTYASFATAVANAMTALNATGGTPATTGEAIGLLFRQAIGGVADPVLAQVTAPSSASTLLDSLLTPTYGSDLSIRSAGGAFGDGWASELNDAGPLGPNNSFAYENPTIDGQAYVAEYVVTYVDQYGDYLGQSISYQIVDPANPGLRFIDPTNPHSDYTQTNANGTIETFSGDTGLVIGISDGQGNAIAITRNAAGVITAIKTASGHPPLFTVNAQGNVTSATDSTGHTITYTYDASGTHLLGTTSAAGTTSYQYSTSTDQFVTNALTGVTNPNGSTQTYTYTAQGDLASQSDNGAAATTYAYSGANTVTQTSGDGLVTTLTYDENGQTTSISDASGGVYNIQRDADGNVTSLTTPAGNTFSFAYDSKDNFTGTTDALGGSISQTYLAGTSDLSSITDQNGNTTQYAYNSAGQLSGTVPASGTGTQYQYNSAGQISQLTEASGATIQLTYNAAGNVTLEQFSDGTSQAYTYNTDGTLASSTAVDGSVTSYAYNAQGLLRSVTNAAGQVESYSYNAAGLETQRVEPDGTITNYAYTSTGQLSQITDGSGAVIAGYTYDAAGVLTRKVTGNGATTYYSHNADGYVTEIKTTASNGTTTSDLTYTYDADGRIATATSGDGTWTYTYDADSQLTHAVLVSTNASIASQNLSYTYDAAGNRTQTIFNGATTNYTTNNLNQYTAADGTTYSYDANGNLATKVAGGVTTTYTYTVQNQLASSTDGTTTTVYSYDALGNIASESVNGVKTTYVTDPLALGSSADGPLSAVAQAYNASGQATATYTYGNGLTSVTSGGTTSYYNADASGNITSLSGASGALTQTYAYSPTGTVLNATGSVVNPFQFNGASGAMTQANGLVSTGVRYYDPTTGRFTTEDPTGQAGGVNLYTYAGNNPVDFTDATGDSISLAGVAAAGTGILAGFIALATLPATATAGTIFFIGGGIALAGGSLYQAVTADGGANPLSLHKDTRSDYIQAGVSFVGTVSGAAPLKGAAYFIVNEVTTLNSIASLFPDYGYVYDYLFPSTVVVKVPKGGGHGDVHLVTFDGLAFDFQAVGEFQLVKSTAPGDNFQVQVRLSALGGSESSPTYTTQIGIQVGNDSVTFGTDRTATVWVDGVASSLSTSANTLTLAGGTISQLSQNTYQVTEKTGEIVNITNNGDYFDYTIALAPSAKANSVEGLLGTYTGTANAFELPDGTVLGSSLSSAQLYETFGNDWRITDGTSLLNYGAGENTATYTDLSHPSYALPVASLPTAVVQAAQQAVAAAGLTGTAASDAVYDYLATGDPSVITNAALDGSSAPVTSTAVITPPPAPPPSIGISSASPTVTEVSGQTAVTFTVSLTSAATADTVVNYAVSATAIDTGKTYFNAADFGGTLPSGAVTIKAGQSSAQVTVEVPDSALGSVPDKWLAVGITTASADPIYATSAQVDILNKSPVAGVAAQPVLEYVTSNAFGTSQFAPTLAQSGNTYTLNLGNVVQGMSLAALQFTLANLASAPADIVVARLAGATGTGFNETGLQTAALINPGNSYPNLNLQPTTTTLGAQSATITIGNTDTNATGYSGALSNITLTVTDNVISAAQATLSATTVNLPDVRVGSTDTQTITVTNSAATGAAPLDVTLGVAAGAVGTGSISQLAPGASSSNLSLGLDTSTAGLKSTFVTLNLASDLGSGASTPLALNQSVAVTGSVYRAAAATVSQTATIVHVGDAGVQDLAVLNSDPADGYSEGLRATATGATGGITATGATGLIAAGTSNSSAIAVHYSTATAGTVSGQVTLGLTSDGTGVDSLTPIALPDDTVAFSVQVDNYATANLQETAGGGTLTGSAANGYDLDLGTLAQNSGPDTIDLAALNSASGVADLLSGTFGFAANTASTAAFTNAGFGAFNDLAAGQSDGALSVALSTATNGTFSETITLAGTGSNAGGYSGSVAPVVLTVHGTVVSETGPETSGTVTGAITEQPGKTGSASLDTANGVIDFTDANPSATHAATVIAVQATGVTTGLPGNAALLSLLSLGALTEDAGATPGSVAWNFAAADSTFDYLAAGETLTLTYAVQIAENGGKAATQDVTVTVTGTNDVPMIASGTTASASIVELVAGGTAAPNDIASGTIDFTDPDRSDIHSASIVSVSSSGTVAGLPSNATLLGLLATTAVTEPAGGTGSVGWNFSAPDATFAYLLPNQTVTLTYVVDVSDNHGGTVAQNVAVTVTGAPGTVKHSSVPGTFEGVAYASITADYAATGALYLVTYYNASNTAVATESFTTDGGYTITVGGNVAEVKTVNSDRSYNIDYTAAGGGGGVFQGVAYASHSIVDSASGVRQLTTLYNAAGATVGTESYTADGGDTITLGGNLFQTYTVNTGSTDTRYYVAGALYGVAFASFDANKTTAGLVDLQTYYNASGAVVGAVSYAANGNDTVTLNGVVAQTKTVNVDGSYDIDYTAAGGGGGVFEGVAYNSHDIAYSASGAREMISVFYESGAVVGTEKFNADGTYQINVNGITGQTYTAQDVAYTASATQLAVTQLQTDGSTVTKLKATNLVLNAGSGIESVTVGTDTFQLGTDVKGTINITGDANATLAFGTGNGGQTVYGFATSGPGADELAFSTSVFADYAHLMGATKQVGSDLLITLDAHDAVLLKNVTASSFTSANVHFT